MVKSVVAIGVLILLSGYFSATETAFTSLNRIRMKNLAAAGNKRAKRVLKLEGSYDTLLTTILIGNNIVNIAMTSIATVLFVNLYGSVYGPTLSTVIITLMVLIFGEISPKSIAKEKAESFSMMSAPVIGVFMKILAPINVLFKGWKLILAKVFKMDKDKGITDEELITIVEEAETEGTIDVERSELIQNAIEFNELEAYDVLTPRVDVEAIDIKEDKAEVAKIFLATGFSRLPVYEENMDRILGVLNQKDFHNYVLGQNREIADFVTSVVFTPGSVKIASLLKKMQKAKVHIAIVVDEFGGTSGLVTMEDIIEEIVGEINDEYDEDERTFTRLNQNTFVFEAKTLLTDFRRIMQLPDDTFDDVAPDADTLAGLLLELKGEFPQLHERLNYDRFTFEVMEMDERRIVKIKVIEKSQKTAPAESENS